MTSGSGCASITMALAWGGVSALAGDISYGVTLNPQVCHEVHLGKFTPPPGSGPMTYGVTSDPCVFEVRSGGGNELYFAAACPGPWTSPWPTAKEKFAVDLNRSGRVRRIDDTAWQAAPSLKRFEGGSGPSEGDQGILYKGKLLRKSGPSWMGKYGQAVHANFSAFAKRAAVNSWDGIEDHGASQDGYPAFIWQVHIEGRYWIDMYDTATAKPLVRIQGSFHGTTPSTFLGYSPAFYSDKYYILPVGATTGGDNQFNMRRLLVCDLDAADR